jgi:hypothetical protein
VWVARPLLAVVSSVDSQKEQQGAREGDGACLGTAASEWALAQATEHPDATPRAAVPNVCSPLRVCAAGSISTRAFGGSYVRQGRLEIIEALCAAVGTRCSFASSWACSKKHKLNVTMTHGGAAHRRRRGLAAGLGEAAQQAASDLFRAIASANVRHGERAAVLER